MTHLLRIVMALLLPLLSLHAVAAEVRLPELVQASIKISPDASSFTLVLTNRTDREITAFATAITIGAGSESRSEFRYFTDLLPVLAIAASGEQVSGFLPGKEYKSSLPTNAQNESSAVTVTAEVIAIVYKDRDATGDAAAIETIFKGRRAEQIGACVAASEIAVLRTRTDVEQLRAGVKQLRARASELSESANMDGADVARALVESVAMNVERLTTLGGGDRARAYALLDYGRYLANRCDLAREHAERKAGR